MNVARPLLPLVEAVDAGFAGAGAFVNGLIDGASAAISGADRERLRSRLLASTVLNAIFRRCFWRVRSSASARTSSTPSRGSGT